MIIGEEIHVCFPKRMYFPQSLPFELVLEASFAHLLLFFFTSVANKRDINVIVCWSFVCKVPDGGLQIIEC